VVAQSGLNARMNDERMIRIENLKLHMKAKGWSQADLARALKRSHTYANRLLSKKAAFGEKAARYIEDCIGRPRGWLDLVHNNAEYSADATDAALKMMERPALTLVGKPQESLLFGLDHGKTFPMAPEISWANIGRDLLKANTEWPVSDQRAVPTTVVVSAKIKWLAVLDDSNFPDLRIGDQVAIDPEIEPKRDQFALFRLFDGSHMLARYRPLPNNSFQAVDASNRPHDRDEHGLTCIAAVVGMFRLSL
jgi:transcriptional regulator with XRE-family HTH domain